MNTKKVLFSIIGIALVVLPLVLAEFVLRIIDYPKQILRQYNEEGTLIYLRNPEVHHDYTAPQTFYVYKGGPSEDQPVLNNINSLGIRGPELPEKKKTRVLVIGDSFVEADEIEADKTFIAHLNRMDPSREYYGKGISSWSPLLHLNWYYKTGYKVQADKIVLVLFANDLYDSISGFSDIKYTSEATFDKAGLPVSFNVEDDRPSHIPWYNNYRIYRLLKNTLSRVKDVSTSGTFSAASGTKKEPVPPNTRLVFPTEAHAANELISQIYSGVPEERIRIEVRNMLELHQPVGQWTEAAKKRVELSISYLHKLDSVAKAHNPAIELYVCLMPMSNNITSEDTDYDAWNIKNYVIDASSLNNHIKTLSKQNGIRFIDAYGYMSQARKKAQKPLYLWGDGHLNNNGHFEFANFIHSNVQ